MEQLSVDVGGRALDVIESGPGVGVYNDISQSRLS
jgi:hypothetical protein